MKGKEAAQFIGREKSLEGDMLVALVEANEKLTILAERFGRVMLRMGIMESKNTGLRDWIVEYNAIKDMVISASNAEDRASLDDDALEERIIQQSVFKDKVAILDAVLGGLFEGLKK